MSSNVTPPLVLLLALLTSAASAQDLISDAVFGCGVATPAGQLLEGSVNEQDMELLTLDTTAFPQALCNDGTPALLYFRPHVGPANAGRWVIQLQGGGSCGNAQDCADRWCARGTGFSRRQMSTSDDPFAAINGLGILDRRPANPMGSWNQVLIRYCSSDGWSGTSEDTIVEADHPVTGQPTPYRIHFLGHEILDAALATLRHDGVQGPEYTYGPGPLPIPMPDLDDAEVVLLAGASAGGMGVANNVDRVGAALRATNTGCQGGSCPLAFRSLIDSAFPPELADLDVTTTEACTSDGACDWQAYLAHDGSFALWQAVREVSCLGWHATNAPGTEWQCDDLSHVIRHHVTTPMFVRMGQTDRLFSQGFVDELYTVPGRGLMTHELFEERVRQELGELAILRLTAEDALDIGVSPGVFGPVCDEHETLRSTPHTYQTSIIRGGNPYTMFDVMENWVLGDTPALLVRHPADQEFCPGAPAVPAMPLRGETLLVLALLICGVCALLDPGGPGFGGKR